MDSIFKALADPSRRDLLDALRQTDGQTLSQLEAALPLSRFGVAKHLGVLETAGLVTRVKRGRFTHHYLNAVPLAEALGRWIEPYRVAPAVQGVLNLKAQMEDTMERRPDYVMRTYIRCTQDALWDALTDADQMAKYHFHASHVTRDGAALTYVAPDGNEMLICRETKLKPKTRIESIFEPRWAPDVPKSHFVWIIEPGDGQCRLTLEHYDIPPGGEGYADGWERIASGLKTFLENGKATKFAAAEA